MQNLTPLASLFLFATTLLAQGPYYVDGQLGVDGPGNGLSPATPWRTISYAMANVTPLPNNTQSGIVYVEGNQTYSPSTNGETLPIVPAYNYALEGTFVGHGVMPVLQIPPGATGVAFPPNVFINRNAVTFRYLVFDGGGYAVTMGANPGFRHRPRIQDCTFRNQLFASIRISNFGQSIDDPRFFQNTFAGPSRGIEVFAAGNGAVVQPDVEECRFTGANAAAIWLQDTSPGGGNVGGTFRSCHFENCTDGIVIRSAQGAVATNASVRKCRFTGITNSAVEVDLARPVDPNVTITECAMLACGKGVYLHGNPLPGSYTLAITDSVLRNCATGVRIDLQLAQGTFGIASSGNLIQQCGTGVGVSLLSLNNALSFGMTSQRDRVLDCPTGVTIGGVAAGSCQWLSGLICRSTGTALSCNTTLTVVARSLTLANNGTGLAVASPVLSSAFDHLVLAGNTTDLAVPPGLALDHCCLQSSSRVGAGNLNFTNPQLVAPFFKLAPTSPCIDAGNVAALLPGTDHEGDPRAAVGHVGGQPVPDLGADEYVLGGSARPFGTGGFGLFNVFPRISSPNTNVAIGTSLQIDLTDAIMPTFAVPANLAALTFGWSDDCGALPFDLGAFGFPGSYLWNDVAATFAITGVNPNGTASVTTAVPPLPALVGSTFAFQWFALMPSPADVVGSNGLRVTIG